MSYRNTEMSAERMRALADPNSTYFKTIGDILRNGAVTQRRAEEARTKVVLPMAVSLEDRVDLERKFMWKLEVKDYGIQGRLPPYVAALSYLMGLRNFMLMGADGEEVIYLDGELPSLVAKGLSYGHVCRTHATSRLDAEYVHEDVQLRQLSKNCAQSVANAADAVLNSLITGDGGRVCQHATTCSRIADTILVNHVRTPVSLMQVVATAKVHNASVVRGVCFFQPEMLYETSGEMQAFPGKFVVDRDADVISFLPREDSSMGFSHPYSSLVSFFINHEYCSGSDRWLVEKHLSGDGVFHYIVRREDVDVRMTEELSANYYRADLTKWVELSYMTYFDEETKLPLRVPKRIKTAILESVYEKVMIVLLSIDAKRLTFDEVFTLLRNHNNMVFSGGDSVRKPQRVYFSQLHRAAVPMLAMAMVRREAATFELRTALPMMKRRLGIHDMGLATLVWSSLCAKVSSLATVSISSVTEDDMITLEKLELDGIDHSVTVKRPEEYVNVMHSSGLVRPFLYGRMEAWLPGGKFRSLGLLAKARAFVMEAVSLGSSARTGDTESEFSTLEGNGASGVIMEEPMPLGVVLTEEDNGEVELEGARRDLAEKLMAQQDALNIGRPPRTVERFEGVERCDVVLTPLLNTDPVAVGQADYDEIFPGVSESDEEVKAYMATEADAIRNVDFVGAINDSKRTLPTPKVIRRSKIRTGGGGIVPRCQASLMSAMCKRNIGVPANRGFVNLETIPGKIVDSIIDVCYVDGWQDILAKELDAGLWLCVEQDIAEYVPKVTTQQMEIMMKEFVSAADEDLTRWLLMVKNVAKPPMDMGAAEKVHLPQTIMYSDQKTVNAKYSAMQTRFFKAVRSMMRPNVSFNNRDSPMEHELWFNSCQGLRSTSPQVWAYEGDIFCYDRSQDHVGQVLELCFYRRHGLNEATLRKWSETHGVKKATSMMFGIVAYIVLQGLSGIWKTLFRNGLLCLGALVYSAELRPEDIVTIDVVGDDFALEANRPVAVGMVVEHFALVFNLTSKLYGTDILYICSKYWLHVDGWWYFVQDPIRKFESLSNAVAASEKLDEKLSEKWISLRDDLRHYDNGIVMEALGEAVRIRLGRRRSPMGIIRALATFAADRNAYLNSFGAEEWIG